MKYRTPPTLPSFLPSGSSSSTPTHWPLANSVVPQNRSVPVWKTREDVGWGGLGSYDGSLAHRQRGGGNEGAPDSNLSSDITIYWLSDVTSLCLNVLLCKIGTETVPTL